MDWGYANIVPRQSAVLTEALEDRCASLPCGRTCSRGDGGVFAAGCALSWKWATQAEGKGGVRLDLTWRFGFRIVQDVEGAHCSLAENPGIHREIHLDVRFMALSFSLGILVWAFLVSVCGVAVNIVARTFDFATPTSYVGAAKFCSHRLSRLGSCGGWQALRCRGQHGRRLGAFRRLRGNSRRPAPPQYDVLAMFV